MSLPAELKPPCEETPDRVVVFQEAAAGREDPPSASEA